MTALAGQVAVVTGASRGIGAAVAARLAAEGARVVRLARSLKEHTGPFIVDIPCDVTNSAKVKAAAARVVEEFGVPDLLVNSVGAFLLVPFEETVLTQLETQLDANLRGPWMVMRRFVPAMRQAGKGRVVTIGSVADHVGFPGNAAYAASKYAVRGLHEALRAEYRGTGVHFTLISPGPTDTAVWDPVNPDARPGFTPRALMLRPDDVADAVLFAATRPRNVDVEWIRLGPA